VGLVRQQKADPGREPVSSDGEAKVACVRARVVAFGVEFETDRST